MHITLAAIFSENEDDKLMPKIMLALSIKANIDKIDKYLDISNHIGKEFVELELENTAI